MTTLPIHFIGAAGQQLAASLEMPVGPVRAVALFAHCFTCTKNSHAARRISMALAMNGIATMRFDFTGLGGSEGDFGNAGFAADVADLVAASAHLEATVGAPAILIGHSLGGAAVLAAAAQLPSVRAVATIGAPFDPAHVLHNIKGDLAAIERDGSGEVTIAGRPFRISAAFLEGVAMQRPAERIARLGRALLVLHSPTDEIVGIDNARLIYEAARHPKSFVTLDGADHLLTDLRDSTYVANLVACWASRYLPDEAEGPEAPPHAVLVGNANGKYGTIIRAGRHRLVADEPLSVPGGEDAGPSPYDLLLAALGACTSMTVKLVADREGIPLERISIRLRHDRNHAKDCDHCEGEGRFVEAIFRDIELTGQLSTEQRARLIQMADKCPVHRTMTGRLHIHTREVPPLA